MGGLRVFWGRRCKLSETTRQVECCANSVRMCWCFTWSPLLCIKGCLLLHLQYGESWRIDTLHSLILLGFCNDMTNFSTYDDMEVNIQHNGGSTRTSTHSFNVVEIHSCSQHSVCLSWQYLLLDWYHMSIHTLHSTLSRPARMQRVDSHGKR